MKATCAASKPRALLPRTLRKWHRMKLCLILVWTLYFINRGVSKTRVHRALRVASGCSYLPGQRQEPRARLWWVSLDLPVGKVTECPRGMHLRGQEALGLFQSTWQSGYRNLKKQLEQGLVVTKRLVYRWGGQNPSGRNKKRFPKEGATFPLCLFRRHAAPSTSRPGMQLDADDMRQAHTTTATALPHYCAMTHRPQCPQEYRAKPPCPHHNPCTHHH